MTLDKEIENRFKTCVIKAYFEKEMGHNFLRVQLNETDLNKVISFSKEISNFVDEMDYPDKDFYLDIFSKGAEINIDKSNIRDYLNQNIRVELNDLLKTKDEFEGELIEVQSDEITVRWNAKGQFRKQPIAFTNIKSINLSLKVKKNK